MQSTMDSSLSRHCSLHATFSDEHLCEFHGIHHGIHLWAAASPWLFLLSFRGFPRKLSRLLTRTTPNNPHKAIYLKASSSSLALKNHRPYLSASVSYIAIIFWLHGTRSVTTLINDHHPRCHQKMWRALQKCIFWLHGVHHHASSCWPSCWSSPR